MIEKYYLNEIQLIECLVPLVGTLCKHLNSKDNNLGIITQLNYDYEKSYDENIKSCFCEILWQKKLELTFPNLKSTSVLNDDKNFIDDFKEILN